jgi:hypothetical protein
MALSVANIYAIRAHTRPPLDPKIQDIISKLKISFKPTFRRPQPAHHGRHRPQPPTAAEQESNWRERILVEMVRKVREKDDPDYDAVNSLINKLTKQTFDRMSADILGKIATRLATDPVSGALFRLRVTTLLFDRGIRQTFYASIMADMYRGIVAQFPDAANDLETQMQMFDTLYDMKNVVSVPHSSAAGYDEAILAWTKQKDTKRSFAVYVAELYSRGLVQASTMDAFVKTIAEELKDGIRAAKTSTTEEHVDSLVRFLFAVANKVPAVKVVIRDVLALPRDQTPCLNMKSRFRMEDALKL